MPVSELEVCSTHGISQVTKMLASYPYKFICSDAKAGVYSSVYLLGFGGGAVAGDSQQLKIVLKENAILILRTQGSTKIFKSVDGKYSTQHLAVELPNGSLFAFLPDPTTCFRGSKYDQHQIYNLQESARWIIFDCISIYFQHSIIFMISFTVDLNIFCASLFSHDPGLFFFSPFFFYQSGSRGLVHVRTNGSLHFIHFFHFICYCFT